MMAPGTEPTFEDRCIDVSCRTRGRCASASAVASGYSVGAESVVEAPDRKQHPTPIPTITASPPMASVRISAAAFCRFRASPKVDRRHRERISPARQAGRR